MSNDDGFLSRWSRRKAQVRSGEAVPEPVPTVPAAPVAPHAAAAMAVPAVAPVPTEAPVPAPVPAAPEPAPLTLDDVAALTPQSDFKPFVARAVDPQVRNAAMKTLFSDPHFNVMDGLDIYIDDYSQPNPLPLELARKLTSAQFMRVFDPPEAAPEVGSRPLTEAVSESVTEPLTEPVLKPSPQTLPGPDPAAPEFAIPEADDAIAVSPPSSMPPTEPPA